MKYLLSISLIPWITISCLNAKSLSFEEVLVLAKGQSPDLKLAKLSVIQAELERNKAISSFFPKIDAFTEVGPGKTKGHFSDTGAYNTDEVKNVWGVALTGDLYDNGKSLTNYKIAGLRSEYAEIKKNQDSEKYLADLIKAFISNSLEVYRLDSLNIKKEALKKEFNYVASAFRQGQKREVDYDQFKGQLERVDLEIMRQENLIHKVGSALQRLLGSEKSEQATFEPIVLKKNGKELVPQLPLVFPTDLSQQTYFYEEKLFTIEGKILNLQSDILQRENYPRISLKAQAAYDSFNAYKLDDTPQNRRWGYEALIRLDFNLFDYGERKKDLQLKNLEFEMTKLKQDISLNEISNIKNDLFLTLKEKTNSIRLYTALLNIEEKNYRIYESDYRKGIINFISLIDSLEKVVEARTGLHQSILEQLKTKVDILYYQGRLNEILP